MRQGTFFYFAMIDNILAIYTQILLVNKSDTSPTTNLFARLALFQNLALKWNFIWLRNQKKKKLVGNKKLRKVTSINNFKKQ